MQRIKLEGKRFSAWLVLEYSHNAQNHSFYRCRCDCGTERLVSGNYLRSGRSKSCSCVQYESARERGRQSAIKRPFWYEIAGVLHAMEQRCSPNSPATNKNYYHRGIKVCVLWKGNRKAFYEWSIKTGYQPGLQIDRINNDGNYEPNNCRWVTRKENMRNTSKQVWRRTNKPKIKSLLSQGHTVSEIAKRMGQSIKRVRSAAEEI